MKMKMTMMMMMLTTTTTMILLKVELHGSDAKLFFPDRNHAGLEMAIDPF